MCRIGDRQPLQDAATVKFVLKSPFTPLNSLLVDRAGMMVSRKAVEAGGADWQVVHDDGVLEIDTRYSARTADGGLLHLRTRGIRSGPPEVLEALLQGAPVAASDYYFRIVVTVETSVPELRHLQDSLLVAAAARSADRVVYDAYRVR